MLQLSQTEWLLCQSLSFMKKGGKARRPYYEGEDDYQNYNITDQKKCDRFRDTHCGKPRCGYQL